MEDWIRFRFDERPSDSEKGDFGRIGFVGGSKTFPNTPAICALASLRTGSDLQKIVAPERAADSCATFAPDLITYPLEGDRLSPDNAEDAVEQLEGTSCIVIGNGIGADEDTLEAVKEIIERTEQPLVLDADALNADLKSCDFEDRDVVLTPHRGEFERLYEEPVEELAALKEQVKKAARVYNATIVVKGSKDVVADGETVRVNETGNPYMTKGGTGDVLAGVCGALLGRARPIEAAYLAATITGTAGDLVADELQQSFTLEELMAKIPEAIRQLR